MALCQITREPIDVDALIAAVQAPTDGALCVFSGVVRADPGPGGEMDRVQVLEYDAYPEMAEAKLAEVAAEVVARWPEQKVAIAHRIGRLHVGEASVVIAVASPHRHESFEACHYAINRVKSTAPIWKKEIYGSGEEWVEGALPGATVEQADSVRRLRLKPRGKLPPLTYAPDLPLTLSARPGAAIPGTSGSMRSQMRSPTCSMGCVASSTSHRSGPACASSRKPSRTR